MNSRFPLLGSPSILSSMSHTSYLTLNLYLNNNHKGLITELLLPQIRPTYKKSKKYLILDGEETGYNILSSGKDSYSKRELGNIEMKWSREPQDHVKSSIKNTWMHPKFLSSDYLQRLMPISWGCDLMMEYKYLWRKDNTIHWGRHELDTVYIVISRVARTLALFWLNILLS